jgi:hypothetical protein
MDHQYQRGARICAILLQDLMKRGVCWCGMEMFLPSSPVFFQLHTVNLEGTFSLYVHLSTFLSCILQWQYSNLQSSHGVVFSVLLDLEETFNQIHITFSCS